MIRERFFNIFIIILFMLFVLTEKIYFYNDGKNSFDGAPHA